MHTVLAELFLSGAPQEGMLLFLYNCFHVAKGTLRIARWEIMQVDLSVSSSTLTQGDRRFDYGECTHANRASQSLEAEKG